MAEALALHITAHAIQRYQERIANWPEAAVRKALSSPAVRLAAQIGAPFVKLGSGHRIALHGARVITVLPAERHPGTLHTTRWDDDA